MTDTFAWVDDIYVSRPHRRKGLSHFLLQHINTLLREKLRIKHVVLYTHDAQELYARHGYVVFDELTRTRWMSLPAATGGNGITVGKVEEQSVPAPVPVGMVAREA